MNEFTFKRYDRVAERLLIVLEVGLTRESFFVYQSVKSQREHSVKGHLAKATCCTDIGTESYLPILHIAHVKQERRKKGNVSQTDSYCWEEGMKEREIKGHEHAHAHVHDEDDQMSQSLFLLMY